jgi:hypothetical protein
LGKVTAFTDFQAIKLFSCGLLFDAEQNIGLPTGSGAAISICRKQVLHTYIPSLLSFQNRFQSSFSQ